MGARADALAKQFEESVNHMSETIEKLTEADWKKVTSAEKWTVGVVAHHVAVTSTLAVSPPVPESHCSVMSVSVPIGHRRVTLGRWQVTEQAVCC